MILLSSEPEMPEGSWKCEKCNNINYPFRTKCNRQNCGADKPFESKKSPSEPAVGNDQVCRMAFYTCLSIFCLSKLTMYVHDQTLKSVGLFLECDLLPNTLSTCCSSNLAMYVHLNY